MTLGEYIELLEKEDQGLLMPIGFSEPHSWRGVYEDLAFLVVQDISISDMLKAAKECLDKTFQGYKGGDFVMKSYTDIHYVAYTYAVYAGGEITPLLLRLLIAYAAGDKPHPDFLLQDFED